VGPFGHFDVSRDPIPSGCKSSRKGGSSTQMIKDFISTLLARFQSDDEEGQTLVEYGLLLALIAIIVIVALLFLGPLVSDIFSNVGNQLT
jgi:pilus assembly protein Flp/PilA